jgi:hypothetical protein
MDRLAKAIAAIDAANSADPHTIEVSGETRPKEQAHAEMMSHWVERLDPECTDEQRIAARAHHLRRWSVPRSSYPEGRSGYLRWRTALRRQHADEVADILRWCGYEEAAIERVQVIVRKQGLGRDPAVQVHEDALCLVFLETQLDDVVRQLGPDATVDVLRKTIRKMSPAALAAAGELPLSPLGAELLDRALAS